MPAPDLFTNQEDDQLFLPEVGPWALSKYRLLFNYAQQFSTSMRLKWDQRVYVDLYSSAGMARIRETDMIHYSSSLLALKVKYPFDRYIFCEEETERMNALVCRTQREHPDWDVRFIEGDVNPKIDSVLSEMPNYSRANRVLGFCFVDPCKMADLKFDTIRYLAERWIDLLILIPTGMDAGRNTSKYERAENSTVATFLGLDTWRGPWYEKQKKGMGFDVFIAKEFHNQMLSIGFQYGGIDESVLIRSTKKNLPLYRRGFFSRHELGGKFWRDVKKSSSIQTNLFE